MNHDPHGYYARLELEWDAPPEAIHTAYRRKARVLHPDIPGTGNADAFMAVKEAYDVLADPLRRAAYDRAARNIVQWHMASGEAEEIRPDPPPAPPVARARGPRLSDLPIVVWAGLAIIALTAGLEVALHLNATTPAGPVVDVPATAPTVAPAAPPPPSQRPIRLIGTPNVYVIPAGGPALVLRYDEKRNVFVAIGQLPAFSAAQALRVVREHGLVEIRLTDTATGFIDASRLVPGNVTAARQAYCAYNAGPTPVNGEVLDRNGTGTDHATIENRSGQPIVIKLRGTTGRAAATVFLDAGGEATVSGLPGGAYRPEYAIGELWSRACNSFAAGMRAQRFGGSVDFSTPGELVVPPELSGEAPPVDISDQDFERD